MSSTSNNNTVPVTPTDFNNIEKGGIIILPWLDAMSLGAGYDIITEQVLGSPADPASDLTPKSSYKPSQNVSFSLKKIESTEQLNNSMAISASVSGS